MACAMLADGGYVVATTIRMIRTNEASAGHRRTQTWVEDRERLRQASDGQVRKRVARDRRVSANSTLSDAARYDSAERSVEVPADRGMGGSRPAELPEAGIVVDDQNGPRRDGIVS
jgi:hypothetical protein